MAASSAEPARSSIAARCSGVKCTPVARLVGRRGAVTPRPPPSLRRRGRSPGRRSRPAAGTSPGTRGSGPPAGRRPPASAISRASSSAASNASASTHVAVDVAAGHVVAHDPAGADVPVADRLVERADRLEPEQLAHGERVERDLQPPVLRPARAGLDHAALVVAHQRAAGGVDVDPVDAPGDADPGARERQRAVLVPVAAEAPLEEPRLEPGAVLGLVSSSRRRSTSSSRSEARAARAVAAVRRSSSIAAVELLERRGSDAGVSRAEPSRSRSRRSVRSSTAWAIEPRRIGSGSGSARLRAQHALDQPAHAAAGERLQPARGLGLARGEPGQHRLAGGRAERRRLRHAPRRPRGRAAARAASAPRPAATSPRRAAAGRAAPTARR